MGRALRDRKEPVPPEDSKIVANKIKESLCYTCKDMVREFLTFDEKPGEKFKTFCGVHQMTGKTWKCDVGYEQFLGPEVFFNPEIFNPQYPKPLSQVWMKPFWLAPSIVANHCSVILCSLGAQPFSKISGVAWQRMSRSASKE